MKIVGEDPNSYEYRSIMNIFEYFSKKQFVNDDIIDAFSFVRKLRNIIAHGGTAGDEDLNRATDLAAFLLTEFNDLKDRLSQG